MKLDKEKMINKLIEREGQTIVKETIEKFGLENPFTGISDDSDFFDIDILVHERAERDMGAK